eukprot:TRINITY_DN4287_c0_g1_i1.p1 TRINITY_DN4287_c0_g1~~TRINITY_DN4287_c0_g1_i1.p1  ORF type:complete len:261 (-),score=35.88 TRINITY_DN4287_c0_g1_i1:60-842(-)
MPPPPPAPENFPGETILRDAGRTMNGKTVSLTGRTPVWRINDVLAAKMGDHHTVFSTNGAEYTGEWFNDLPEGNGVLVTAKGGQYEGGFVKGLKDGVGTLWVNTSRVPTKDVRKLHLIYTGEWLEGVKHGQGEHYSTNGDKYSGEWINDKREGWGLSVEANGAKYQGQWSNDLMHGQGTLISENGDRYEGSFMDGEKHGNGVLFYVKKGRKVTGTWCNGSLKTGEFDSWDGGDVPAAEFPKIGLANPKEVIENAKESIGF